MSHDVTVSRLIDAAPEEVFDAFTNPDGQEALYVFEALDRPRRVLVSTTETRLDGSTLRFETEFRFEARDGRTLMTMTQRGLPTAQLREEHRRGVPNALARLQRVIRLSRSQTEARRDPTR